MVQPHLLLPSNHRAQRAHTSPVYPQFLGHFCWATVSTSSTFPSCIMLCSKQSNTPTAYNLFRPMTPPGQTSIVWELGNVPIAPGFYDGDQDVQLDIMILPLVQVTDPDSKTSNLFDPFLPKVPQWCPRLKFSSPKKPRVLLPAFSPKSKRSQSELSGSSTSDST